MIKLYLYLYLIIIFSKICELAGLAQSGMVIRVQPPSLARAPNNPAPIFPAVPHDGGHDPDIERRAATGILLTLLIKQCR
jgi:hypothetical protein